MTKQDMLQILCDLQDIQGIAFEKGIYKFEISSRVYPPEEDGETEERFLDVTIFRTGDDSEEDYYRVSICHYDSYHEITGKISLIKHFINKK